MNYIPLLLAAFSFFSCTEQKDCPEIKEEIKSKVVTSTKSKIETKSSTDENYERIEFKAADGVKIIGNYYEIDPNAPIIILCHQARFNKFEYAGIAPKIVKMGYNCLAIDQRSGGPISIFQNETMINSISAGKPTDMLDAEQDILAAIDWAYDKSKREVILWGSSYSSTLSIYIGMGNDKVKTFIAFSPGNYWSEKKGDLKAMLPTCEKSYFITSTKYENTHIKQFMSNVKLKRNQVVFIPKTEGYHGSQALWDGQAQGEQYWNAITEFLRNKDILNS